MILLQPIGEITFERISVSHFVFLLTLSFNQESGFLAAVKLLLLIYCPNTCLLALLMEDASRLLYDGAEFIQYIPDNFVIGYENNEYQKVVLVHVGYGSGALTSHLFAYYLLIVYI